MSEWPIGLSTGCFYNQSIFDCLDAIVGSGFNLVEVCSSKAHLDYHDVDSIRRIAARFDSLGIGAYSFHAPFAEHIDISAPDDERRNASIREVIIAAEAAALLGARHFVIHPGPEHAEQPPGEQRLRRLDHVAHSLNEIASRCRRLGLLCVIENKLPHLLFGNTPDMLWILGAMNSADVGVCLDTGHAYLAGELDTAVQKLGRHLRIVHASDNRGQFDDHLPPGRGRIDWPRFLRLLKETEFHGSIIIEMAGRGEPREILAAAAQARQFLWREACGLG